MAKDKEARVTKESKEGIKTENKAELSKLANQKAKKEGEKTEEAKKPEEQRTELPPMRELVKWAVRIRRTAQAQEFQKMIKELEGVVYPLSPREKIERILERLALPIFIATAGKYTIGDLLARYRILDYRGQLLLWIPLK